MTWGIGTTQREEGLGPPEEPLQAEPPQEPRQLEETAKRTLSTPRKKSLTGPHASKDAVEELPKRAKMPKMQTHGETPQEMEEADWDRG
jgi:hypothetical protein